MTTMTHTVDESVLAGATGVSGIDLECTHKVIGTLVEILQRNFKEDTKYMRPLMPPQANILFVLDREAAERMTAYMSEKLREVGGFELSEFRFTLKSGANGEVLQRVRLEFPEGVNTTIIRKMLIATDRLERVLPAFQA